MEPVQARDKFSLGTMRIQGHSLLLSHALLWPRPLVTPSPWCHDGLLRSFILLEKNILMIECSRNCNLEGGEAVGPI